MPFDAETTMKLIWLALLLIFAVAEGISVGLTSVWFAAGSLAALVVALFGGALWIQVTLFLGVSLLCLAAVRPLARKHLNNRVEATNADRVIGAEAQVTEDINNLQGKGAVRVGGLTWSARSQDNSEIPTGTLVKILRIEGVKVYVERIPVASQNAVW